MRKILLNLLRNYFPLFFLKLKYFNLKRKPSDINEHLETLSSYTEGCTKVFETGVRGVVSSWALLHGLNTNKVDGKKFVMNDIDNVNVDSICQVGNSLNIETVFIQGNNLDLDLNEKFDLVFIDTLHVYGQLKRELEKFSKIAETYIILHDTTVDAEYGEIIRQNLDFEKIKELTNFSDEELTKGLWPAVEEFIAKNNDWEIQKKFENNNGLTILKKTKS